MPTPFFCSQDFCDCNDRVPRSLIPDTLSSISGEKAENIPENKTGFHSIAFDTWPKFVPKPQQIDDSGSLKIVNGFGNFVLANIDQEKCILMVGNESRYVLC